MAVEEHEAPEEFLAETHGFHAHIETRGPKHERVLVIRDKITHVEVVWPVH